MMTHAEIGYPYRLAVIPDVNPLPITAVAMSPNGQFLLAAFGNSVLNGSGVFITGDFGASYSHLHLNLDRFDSSGLYVNDHGSFIAVIGWSETVDRNLFLSYDGGHSFGSSQDTIGVQYLTSSGDMHFLYATQFSETPTVVVSHDFGKSFTTVHLNCTSFYMFTSIASSKDGNK
jgi:hypothetical protein